MERTVLSTCRRVLLVCTSSMAFFTSIRASPSSWGGEGVEPYQTVEQGLMNQWSIKVCGVH